jgi:HSP20 family protein
MFNYFGKGEAMTGNRWQQFSPIWNQLQQFQSEMNRVFDRWNGDGSSLAAYPTVNIWEDGDHLHVEAELPGLDLKDLEIYVTGGNELTIKGQRQLKVSEQGAWHRRERASGAFIRSLTLPYPVDADKVEARLEHGVLHITLAKHESARPRKIPIKAE